MILKLAPYKVIVFIFFVIFLGLGLFLVKDYGISWDEDRSRENGILSINYILKGDQSLLQYKDREYGVVFEIVLVALEKGLGLGNNYRAIYLMRHLTTFLLFYLGVIFFYKLCKKIFGSWRTGLLGCLFLILSPRIFADAFYNSKDIPCLSVFIISIYTLINYLENKSCVNAFILAFVSAVLIDIRVVGTIIPFLTLLFIFMDIFMMRSTNIDPIKVFWGPFVYCFFLIIFTILFWPFLWASPLNNFIFSLFKMSHFGGITVLYLGQYVDIAHLPWHYIPLWIAISTPLVYVVTFCVGYIKTIILAGKDPVRFYRVKKAELLILLLISLPVLAVIIFKSGLYDAWRQMFFIYPAFLIISISGLRALFYSVRRKNGGIFIQTFFVLLVLCNLSCVVFFMIRNHPYQNVYFNVLAGRNMKEIKNKFELDYWGLSYTKALEYIAKNDPGRIIKIYMADPVESWNASMLDDNDRRRLVFVNDLKEAKYFLSDFRWHKEEYPYKNEYYSIKVDGAAIVVVYRL